MQLSYPAHPPVTITGGNLWVLWEGRPSDAVGSRHPLCDGNAIGVRNTPENGGATEGADGVNAQGCQGKPLGEHDHRGHRRRYGFAGDQPHGHGEDAHDDVTGAVCGADGCGVEGSQPRRAAGADRS